MPGFTICDAPMTANSDLRLSRTLLLAVTILAGIFAGVSVVTTLKRRSERPWRIVKPVDIEKSLDSTARVFNEFASLEVASRTEASARIALQPGVPSQADSLKITTVYPATRTIHRRSARMDSPDASTAGIRPKGDDGICVPVNMHPVTVHLEGSAISGEMARPADDINRILETQRTIQKTRPAALPVSQTASDPNDEHPGRMNVARLEQIDASIRELSSSFESLRDETRAAVAGTSSELTRSRIASEQIARQQQELKAHCDELARATPVVMTTDVRGRSILQSTFSESAVTAPLEGHEESQSEVVETSMMSEVGTPEKVSALGAMIPGPAEDDAFVAFLDKMARTDGVRVESAKFRGDDRVTMPLNSDPQNAEASSRTGGVAMRRSTNRSSGVTLVQGMNTSTRTGTSVSYPSVLKKPIRRRGSPLRRGGSVGIDAATDFEKEVRHESPRMIQRLPGPNMSGIRNSILLHRLKSAVQNAGRSRILD